MKRVKKDFRMELRDGNGLVVAVECSGKLRMKESTPTTFDAVDLTATQCEALGIAAALEDVPTPGQRLHEECKTLRDDHPWDALDARVRACYENAAVRLGIKSEGES